MSTIREKPVLKRQGAFLPQWTMDGSAYHIVFRLIDALPAPVLREWEEGKTAFLREYASKSGTSGEREWGRLQVRLTEEYLDRGCGICLLARPRGAADVRDALRLFHGERYHLYAWSIMPNHVHVIAEPFPGNDIASILHSWKSFTSRTIGAAMGRAGQIWHKDTYEQILRKPSSFDRAVQHVLDNPVNAGLKNWTWTSAREDAYRRVPRWLSTD